MIRRSAGRLGKQLASTVATDAAAGSVGGGVAMARAAAPALQLYAPYGQQGASSSAFGAAGPFDWSSVRHFSFAPPRQAAADSGTEVLPSEGAAAAASEAVAGSSGALALTPDAIVEAAAGAEAAALIASAEDAWLPTRGFQYLLSTAHEGGLPWVPAIALTTVAMRSMTLPLAIMQIKNTYRLSQARPEIEALLEHLKEEQARGNQNATAEYQGRVQAVWSKYGANPLKSLAGIFVQMPIFIGFFSALRAFAAHKVPSLTEGGALWFTDLTLPDPYYIMPVLAGLSMLATVELGALDGMQGQPESTQKRTKMVMRFVSLAIVPFTMNMPAGVFVYWVTSNIFSLIQTSALKNKTLKTVLGLPDLTKANVTKEQELVGKPIKTFAHKPLPKRKT